MSLNNWGKGKRKKKHWINMEKSLGNHYEIIEGKRRNFSK